MIPCPHESVWRQTGRGFFLRAEVSCCACSQLDFLSHFISLILDNSRANRSRWFCAYEVSWSRMESREPETVTFRGGKLIWLVHLPQLDRVSRWCDRFNPVFRPCRLIGSVTGIITWQKGRPANQESTLQAYRRVDIWEMRGYSVLFEHWWNCVPRWVVQRCQVNDQV